MKSYETLKKYINYTFADDVIVDYTSLFTASIVLSDGVIKLLALGDNITVFINDKEIQTLALMDDKFYVVK